MMDDAELLRCYTESRSETAFAEFVERRIGFVYATAFRQSAGNAHTAQDIAQAVFVLAAKNAAHLAKHECLAGWLYATASNIASEARREARRRYAREQEAMYMSEIQHNDESVGENFEKLRPLLDDALGVLRENERRAVLMRFFEGCAFAEIGSALKMSEDAARMRVARAVEKMRALFAKRGVKSSAAALGAFMSAEAAIAAPAGLAVSITGAALSGSATVVAATAAVAGAVTFMSTTKIAIIAATVVMAAVSVGFFQQNRAWAAESALTAAQRDHAALLAQVRDAGQRASEVNKQETATRAPIVRLDPVAMGDAFMAAHPEVREALLQHARARKFAQYYGLYREMGWSDEQIAAFEGTEISAGSFHDSMTLQIVAMPKAEARRLRSELLGEEGMKKYDAYSGLFNNGYVHRIAGALYDTANPLTMEQRTLLRATLTDVSNAFRNHGRQISVDKYWDAVAAEARAYMTEVQVSSLADIKEADAWRVKWNEAQAAQSAAKAAANKDRATK